MPVASLHPDKMVALQSLVEKNRRARGKAAAKQVSPKKSYGTKPREDGSSLLKNLAYRLHDRRFSDHYARLSQVQPPAPGSGRG